MGLNMDWKKPENDEKRLLEANRGLRQYGILEKQENRHMLAIIAVFEGMEDLEDNKELAELLDLEMVRIQELVDRFTERGKSIDVCLG